MTIIKAVSDYFFNQKLWFSSVRSILYALAPSLSRSVFPLPHLRSLLYTRSSAHYLSHLHSQLLTFCGKSSSLGRRAGRKGRPFEKQPQCNTGRAKLKAESSLWRKAFIWKHGLTSPAKARLRHLRPLERRAHHQTSPPQALSLYFGELKATCRLLEVSQTVIRNTKTSHSKVYAVVLQWHPRHSEPISFLKVLQMTPTQSTECAALRPTQSYSLLSTLHSLSQPTTVLLQNPT